LSISASSHVCVPGRRLGGRTTAPGRATRTASALLVALSIALASSPLLAQSDRPKLLLLPIVVHSSENPRYLRDGLADMLTTRFIQEGSFEIIRVDDSRRSTTRVSEALEAARSENADFVLFGSFTRFGEGASLDMQAASTAEGEEGQTLREIFVHSGSIGEVIPDLTDLVGKVTRFAVPGYTGGPAAVSDGPAGARAPSRDELADLRRRVAALEQAIRALEQSGGVTGP